jgi:ABC-type phosphate transport system ATPase subunit
MVQASRVREECTFMLMWKVIEHPATEKVFVTPGRREMANYIEGRYG